MSNPASSPISLSRRIVRRLRYEWFKHINPLYWRITYRDTPPPALLVRFSAGIGDNLLCTAIFRALRERGGQNLWMMSKYPDLFTENPDIDRIVPAHTFFVKMTERGGGRFETPNYTTHIKAEDRDLAPTHHMIANLCGAVGITGKVALRPYMYLTESEKNKARELKPQIVIQSSILAAPYPISTKEWYPERMQAIVNALRERYTIIQLGSPRDPLMQGALDYRGKTSLRESAAILSQALLLVSPVGFLMHLARAVDCRAVTVFGGREHPSQSGYSCNENLFSAVPCAPCWIWNSCPYDRKCMQQISSDDVLQAVYRQLDRVGEPLEVEYADSPRSVPELGIYR
jgi:ADP-heptose:LPS heptosyltransferase